MEDEAWRGFEMRTDLQVEVECLGKVLEGEGKITSTLPEHEYTSFGEALKQSVVEIDEPDCAACIDGRCVKCLKNNEPGRNRPKKAGGSISTFVMMGIGDKNFQEGLHDTANSPDDLYAAADQLQEFLGNKPGGHIGCGAAGDTEAHTSSVANLKSDSPAVNLTKEAVKAEAPDQDSDEVIDKAISQAAPFTYILQSRRWNGTEYIDRMAAETPEAVEVLETKDDELHGHAEDATVVVDGPVDDDMRPLFTIDKDRLKELTGREVFIVNQNELRRDAHKLGSSPRQIAQLYAASLLYHFGGVYKKLADGSQPLYIVRIAQ
jgi:hypothetical protein